MSQPIPTQALITGGNAVTLDLRNYFSVPGISSQAQIVQFDTVLGRFNVEMLPNAAPRHVTNFLNYVQTNAYTSSFFHRAAAFEGTAVSIVQAGGYRASSGNITEVPKFDPVALEYNLPNARGTLAAARTTDPNSARSEFFFNTRDNSTILGPSNGGGYSVFGRVIGSGMNVVDAIAALPRVDARGGNANSPFGELPVRNYTPGTEVTASHLIIVNSVTTASLFPTGGGSSVVTFSMQNPGFGVVEATLSGSTLTLTPATAGTANITIRAVDSNNNAAETTFTVNVTSLVPAITHQPVSQTVASGSTVVFNVGAVNAESYQWQFNGINIPGAVFSSYVITGATSASNGSFRVIATNAVSSVTSQSVTLNVVNADPTSVGRLINLSILTSIRAPGDAFSMGYVVGGSGTSGAKPLVLRAAGPSLGALGVPSTLPDPKLEFFAGATKTGENDNWGGGQSLVDAMAAVGAFAYTSPTSLDSASLANITTRDNSVRVSAANNSTGTVIAEVYDATPAASVTTATPRLLNVSVLKIVDANTSMTAGFVLRGQTARTVLIRAIGPGLQAAFGVSDVMSDPQLTLFNSSSVKIAENDNWGGETPLRVAMASVGAFNVTNSASRDAMLLMTLAPGAYTAEVKGVGGVGGNVIVEVYEVP